MKGSSCDELKKVKHVVQYAIFAAYHLSLETSFLADEGATLPKMKRGHPIAIPERATTDFGVSSIPDSHATTNSEVVADCYVQGEETVCLNPELEGSELSSGHFGPGYGFSLSSCSVDCVGGNALFDVSDDLASNVGFNCSPNLCEDKKRPASFTSNITNFSLPEMPEIFPQQRQPDDVCTLTKSDKIDDNDVSSEYFSSADTHQSILVSYSSHCVQKGTVCERSRLMRIKFYGCFDKPLGRYLRDDLFDQVTSYGFPFAYLVILFLCADYQLIRFFISRQYAADLVKNQLRPMFYATPISREILQLMLRAFLL